MGQAILVFSVTAAAACLGLVAGAVVWYGGIWLIGKFIELRERRLQALHLRRENIRKFGWIRRGGIR